MRPDGDDPAKLRVAPENDFPIHPSWTKDGRRIIFKGDAYLPAPPFAQFTLASGIRIIDRNGGNDDRVLVDLGLGSQGHPVWSPTANLVALTLDGGQFSSRIGISNPRDDAVAEAFWVRMQVELLNRRRWRTRLEPRKRDL